MLDFALCALPVLKEFSLIRVKLQNESSFNQIFVLSHLNGKSVLQLE